MLQTAPQLLLIFSSTVSNCRQTRFDQHVVTAKPTKHRTVAGSALLHR